MNHAVDPPPLTICVLTFGNYPELAGQVLDSIRVNCPRHSYALFVGANAVCEETRRLLTERHEAGEIDRLIVSTMNLGKSAMMGNLFADVSTELIWWFDDDSYIMESGSLSRWLHAANSSPPSTVLWGQVAFCKHLSAFTDLLDVSGLVRSALWYRGLPPPSWRPGGKGEFNFRGRDLGDGRWIFVLGGCFMIRSSAVRAMGWPDPRLFLKGEDVFLGEAVRQQGWTFENIGSPGVALDTEPGRGLRK